jgi:hypothetical protein
MTQGIFEQKGTEIGNRPPFFLGARQQCFMNVIAERNRDPSRLTLQHPKSLIHR